MARVLVRTVSRLGSKKEGKLFALVNSGSIMLIDPRCSTTIGRKILDKFLDQVKSDQSLVSASTY